MPSTDPSLVGITINAKDSSGLITQAQFNGLPGAIPTTASKFAVACEIECTGDGNVYRNSGTTASPVWNNIDLISANSEIDQKFIQYATVNVSSADLLALYTTAKQLIAAPSAGQFIEVISATVKYLYGTGAYTIGSATNLSLNYTDKNGVVISDTRTVTGLIDQTANKYAVLKPVSTGFGPADAVFAAPVVLKLAGGNPSVGDGTLQVNIAYRIHTL